MNCPETDIELLDLHPPRSSFRADVLDGLSRDEKQLPCKYFYDEAGSRLFDEICGQPEYYLTTTELEIMEDHIDDLAESIGSHCMLIEFGSGSGIKTRMLLEAVPRPLVYVPVDISREHLMETTGSFAVDYPDVEMLPVCGDFTRRIPLPETKLEAEHHLVYFPGSTIGNFTPAAATRLLANIADTVGPQGRLLVGIDLQKDRSVLERAYNDEAGVTGEFNLNLLRRINRELEADFDLDEFEHRAVFNDERGRIEMHLVSRRQQRVTIGDAHFDFAAGESICTEYSHKYQIADFAGMAARAGFTVKRTWTDKREYFALLLLGRE